MLPTSSISHISSRYTYNRGGISTLRENIVEILSYAPITSNFNQCYHHQNKDHSYQHSIIQTNNILLLYMFLFLVSRQPQNNSIQNASQNIMPGSISSLPETFNPIKPYLVFTKHHNILLHINLIPHHCLYPLPILS